jgi:hypothetical protein
MLFAFSTDFSPAMVRCAPWIDSLKWVFFNSFQISQDALSASPLPERAIKVWCKTGARSVSNAARSTVSARRNTSAADTVETGFLVKTTRTRQAAAAPVSTQRA